MKIINNIEQLNNLEEVIELRSILEKRGYKYEVFSKDDVLSIRLVKGTVIVEIEVSDKINIWSFSSGSNKEELKEAETDLKDSCEILSYIGDKYEYTLSESEDSFYKEFEDDIEESNGKTFLIINEDKVDLEQKVSEFVIWKFGEEILDKVSIDVHVDEEDLGTPDYTEYLTIQLFFNEYKYNNEVYGEQTESVGLVLRSRGLQPFYIDGKFVSLTVYEHNIGNIIQKHDIIYGFNKDEISNDFDNFILTC